MQGLIVLILLALICFMLIQVYQTKPKNLNFNKQEEAEYREWQQQFTHDLDIILERQREREFQRHLIKLDYMENIDDLAFEGFVADVLNQYGYNVKALMRGGDKGKDLVGKTPLGYSLYGEVKHYVEEGKVGRPYLQKLIGAGKVDDIEAYIFVATCGYSRDAIEYAYECNQKGIPFRLIDGEEFHQMVYELREKTIQEQNLVVV